MTPGRMALLAVACVASGGLIAGYGLEASSHRDILPLPLAMFLWLCSIVSWQGFVAAQVCAALVEHMDNRLIQLLTSIRGLDDDTDRKTIDNHLAALAAVGGPTPIQRRPRPHPVHLRDR